jgi:hypothetical protein
VVWHCRAPVLVGLREEAGKVSMGSTKEQAVVPNAFNSDRHDRSGTGSRLKKRMCLRCERDEAAPSESKDGQAERDLKSLSCGASPA